jgi:hypothetical protein
MLRSLSPLSIVTLALAAAGCAAAPTAPLVEIAQVEHTTDQDLVVTVKTQSLSSRGDGTVSYRYTWLVDGALVSDLTEDTVPAIRTRKGQQWTALVAGDDGKQQSANATARTTIINSAPEVMVSVSNETPISTQSVQASVEFYDADGDPVEVRYTWFKNGRKVPELQGPDLLADFIKRDEVWRVQVVGFDGEVEGYPDRVDILVQNGQPEVHSVVIGPESPDTTMPLVAVVEASDPDDDPLTNRFVWYVNGEPRAGLTSALVPSDRTTRGQTWQAEVYAADDVIESAPKLSNIIEIRNSIPTAPVVEIEDGPEVSSFADMYCRVVAPSTDADRDALTYTFIWYRDGVEWTGATKRTVHAGDTIPWEITDEGDMWSCAAFASDGLATTPVVESSEVTIIAILEYRLGAANLINMGIDCSGGNRYGGSGTGGVFWTDTGSVRPATITIEYQMGVNCGGPSSRAAYITGTYVGTTPTGDTSQCTCTPTKYKQKVSFAAPSSYVPGGRNEFTMQWLSSDGWSSNPDWKDGSTDIWAIVTVAY